MSSALDIYLGELRDIRASGAAVKETSGYGALANLFSAIGHTLKPKVHCIIQLKNSGAGLPDGGLFTPDQLKNTDEKKPLLGVPQPSRGVIEVKGTADEIDAVAASKQVRDYLKHYGQVLVTNYRDFVLLKRGDGGAALRLESFCLAANEAAFWNAAAHPRKMATELGERFAEYIKRVLLHAAPLNNPRDVAFFLASYARDAHVRVEHAGDLPALTAIRTALEEALGMKFEAEKGEHFFRSTLVQTIFYGVFSAWVLWHKENPVRRDAFDWKAAAWTLHVPMIKALFDQVATPTKLGPLGLVEVLDWTAAALNRVDRAAFFERFVESHAVQYFYEPFLEAFDPELRKQLGVWYTPPEIVEYMVARVDTALREELHIADGLADPRVFVLDPCCGTGAYLVEVLRKIVKTLKEEKGEGALAELEAKEAAQKRVFGFEIMPAPFVVAHLQMGLLLQNLGVALDDAKNERVGIFLTNALTGWDENTANPQLKNWPELEAERAGAGRVKQEKPILVIIGNPPYNAYAGISPKEEQGLVEPYKGIYWTQKKDKAGKALFDDDKQPIMESHYRLSDDISKGGWGIKKFNMDELYVRFFRLAERRIAEKTGKGIVCYISSFSYLADPSFVVMRQRFLEEFDTLWFDCLNGDSRETGKSTPEGKPDPSVFSTKYNREGIKLGTTVGLLVRQANRSETPKVLFRQFWGASKRIELLASLAAKKFKEHYEEATPRANNRHSFKPLHVSADYFAWPSVVSFCQESPISGLQEMRHSAFIDIEKEKLQERMRAYLDKAVAWENIQAMETGLTRDAGGFSPMEARLKALRLERFDSHKLFRYALYPFDLRWCYYTQVPTLWNRPRPELVAQAWSGNRFFITRMFAERPHEQITMTMTAELPDYHLLRPNAVAIPIRLRAKSKSKPKKKDDGNGEFSSIVQETAPAHASGEGKITANLSMAVRAYLASVGINHPDADAETAALIWMHTLAIGYAPAYLAENADGIRQDWPRIPLPASRDMLLASADLGKQIAVLIDTETPVEGVTAGKLRRENKIIAVLSSTVNLSLTVGWGHAGQGGVTMPGKGKLDSRDYTAEERPTPEALALLGAATCDIYLNDAACWRNVPANVWDYTIGGYQVLKKWLSYREHALLGRAVTADEAREFTHNARRIAALLLLQPDLDRNFQTVKTGAAIWTDFSPG